MIGRVAGILVMFSLMGFASPNPKRANLRLDLIKEDSARAWEPIGYLYVPFPVRLNSRNFLLGLLKPEASPFRDSGFKMEIKTAKDERFNDLIRYTWTFNNREIRITESLNAIRIHVPRSAGQDPDKEFGWIMGSMIQVKGISADGKPYRLRIPRLQGLASGDFFSSNPDVRLPWMISWRDRFDGVIRDEGFQIDFYKKIGQLIGFRDGHGWIRRNCGLQPGHQSRPDGSMLKLITTGIYAVPMGPSACPEHYSPVPIKTSRQTLDSLQLLLEKGPNAILVALDLARSKDRVYVPLLAGAFRKSGNDQEKQYFAHALVRLGQKDTTYANFMLKGLHAGDSQIAALSAEGLANLGESRFADSIIKSMENRPLREREAMATSLVCFDSPEAGRTARKYAAPKKRPDALRQKRD